MRIGYAIGSPNVIQWLERTKLPFDPNGPGCSAALAALDDAAHVRATVEANATGLAYLHEHAIALDYVVSESVANFVMIDAGSNESAVSLHASLLNHGIITRPLVGFGLPTCVRISTGTETDNRRVAQALSSIAQRTVFP
jgi:histidinol-phosphate aminotransferase